ncbi:type 1 glutamine amidotransferase domain-containing protein [Priestia megaterium]|jgi:putative intracellular protease/amidase|uniref:type 1 glutamine amidotransferase domain-containing protein n=1 Tax=Priestia TaxID=2800373 RepID=UPI00034BCE55|nr:MULTISPECIES: type 1 glutamine amidotransferase domain-containing protein [Priestia]AYE51961.1 type 1 glutamine amidotransferase domain-containing protein [Priestia megaterium NCT-2]MDC0702162.1 type 1 glutamine amidotransferase domain-containing protein [Priestia sp. AB]MDH3187868.1 type 1 glutamine amidotransferase domain-containing protein [Priestia megaterium]MDM8148316.1 type 1 glutamine amidotransferase domain-containing protein [Priestia megaterium]MDQ0803978.1 putative intracellular
MTGNSKILMVVTNGHTMENGELAGIWLTEFSEAYLEFKKEGYEVVVASPKGGTSPVDPNSLTDDVTDEDKEAGKLLENTKSLADISSQEFAGMFVPGGHGTMFDFPDDTHLHRLLTEFAEDDKLIAAVCHGPAALVGGKLKNGEPIVKGKRITAFTDSEEKDTTLDKYMPFLLETKLRELGAEFIAKDNWSDHIEVDGKLLTGQNPQSTISLAKEFVRALNA